MSSTPAGPDAASFERVAKIPATGMTHEYSERLTLVPECLYPIYSKTCDVLVPQCAMEPPVPVPNTVVKRRSADSTARATLWEDRPVPGHTTKTPLRGFLFCRQRALIEWRIQYASVAWDAPALRNRARIQCCVRCASATLDAPALQPGEAHVIA